MIAKGSHGVAGNTYAWQLWCSIAFPNSDDNTRGHDDKADHYTQQTFHIQRPLFSVMFG